MKVAMGAIAALVLAGVWWTPAQAQVPQGSYLRSCSEIRMEGDRLVGTCRRLDGREQRTALPDVNRCVGDIGNANGNLTCVYGRAGPPPQVGPGPGPGPRFGEERRERCEGLHREAEELRARLEREFNPIERARMDGRLRELREEEERCRR